MNSSDLEQLKAQLSALIQTTIESTFENIQKALENNITPLRKSVSQLEEKDKKKNIVVYGIPENNPEKYNDLELLITNLGSKLGMVFDFDHAFRLGKNKGTGRPILIRLMRTRDKFRIFENRSKLKGTNIYINEDLTESERKKNSLLLKKAKELRQSNPYSKTIIRTGKLIFNDSIRKVIYTVNANGELQEELGGGSGIFPMDGGDQ